MMSYEEEIIKILTRKGLLPTEEEKKDVMKFLLL